MIEELRHLYRPRAGSLRACNLKGGVSYNLPDVNCPACLLIADLPPALDDMPAVEAWLAS